MSSKIDITKLDLYGILNVTEEATEKEIVKSYRRQALKCHPDKNPDNPLAAEQFHKLTKALEILTDAAAKAAYDKILKARKAAEIRHRQYDAKRKKFKDDLDARENAAQQQKENEVDDAKKLQAEIERLRKEGNRILEEVQEKLREDLKKKMDLNRDKVDSDSDSGEAPTAKLKIKWKLKKGEPTSEGYSKEDLENIFTKYGEILNIVMSVKKSGTAIVEFASSYAADLAVQSENGKPSVPLTLSWLQGQPSKDRLSKGHDPSSDERSQSNGSSGLFPSASNFSGQSSMTFSQGIASDNKDFESVVLMKMRQAEERKRLIEQMKNEDEENT